MIVYTIYTRNIHQTLLHGLMACAKKLKTANPEWEYQFVDEGEAHLNVLDFTTRERPDSLNEDDLKLLSYYPDSSTLVLLRSEQSQLAKHLIQSYRCSLLCVDECHFRMRELVESSLKKKRYVSPVFLRHCEVEEKCALELNFTPAEYKVLHGLCRRETGTEMSAKLFRSQRTISSHKRSIMRKLGVKDAFELHQVLLEIQASHSIRIHLI